MKSLWIMIILGLALSANAKKGDTVNMSVQRYGKPVGEINAGKRKILTFETRNSKITEVYDAQGICVSSFVAQKEVAQPVASQASVQAIKKQASTVARTAQRNSVKQKIVAQEQKVVQPMKGMAVVSEPLPVKPSVSLLKVASVACLSGMLLMSLYCLIRFLVKNPTFNFNIDISKMDQLGALTDFMQSHHPQHH